MGKPHESINSVIYVAHSIIVGMLTVILYPVITEKISAEAFGVFALSIVYSAILTGIANLGCIVGYERNYFIVEDSKENGSKLLVTTQLFVGASFFIFVSLGLFFSEVIVDVLFQDHTYQLLWEIILISTALSSFTQYYLTYLKNKGLAKIFFKITIFQSVLNFLIAWAMINYSSYGVYSLAYALIISNLLMSVVSIYHQLSRNSIGVDKSLLLDVLRVSLPLTPRVLFGFLNTYFDKIMLGSLSAIGNVGIYTIAQKISSFIFVFMTAIERVFKPAIFRMLFAEEEPNKIGCYLTPFVFVSFFPALILILFSIEIVGVLLADEYAEASIIIVILSIYYSSMFVGKVIGVQLVHAKKTWLISYLTLWGILLNIALNVPLIYFWGSVGAALATTVSLVVMTAYSYYISRSYSKIEWDIVPVAGLHAILLLSAIYCISIAFDVLLVDYFVSLFIKLLFLFIYVCLGIVFGVVNKESFYKAIKLIRFRSH